MFSGFAPPPQSKMTLGKCCAEFELLLLTCSKSCGNWWDLLNQLLKKKIWRHCMHAMQPGDSITTPGLRSANQLEPWVSVQTLPLILVSALNTSPRIGDLFPYFWRLLQSWGACMLLKHHTLCMSKCWWNPRKREPGVSADCIIEKVMKVKYLEPWKARNFRDFLVHTRKTLKFRLSSF